MFICILKKNWDIKRFSFHLSSTLALILNIKNLIFGYFYFRDIVNRAFYAWLREESKIHFDDVFYESSLSIQLVRQNWFSDSDLMYKWRFEVHNNKIIFLILISDFQPTFVVDTIAYFDCFKWNDNRYQNKNSLLIASST